MSGTALPIGREVHLDDRYRLEEGVVLVTGVQAIVRLIVDQMRADRATGHRVGAFVSGYQGSPLAGLDLELGRQADLCDELGIKFQPGLNEELAATSVWGTQIVPALPGAEVDGVLGVWYGKAPGLDRAADALRHGNHSGAHPLGGMLAVVGDDPSCKSSTLPSASETMLAAVRMPIVYPGSPAEVIELGRLAIAASRLSGTWVGMKIATAVADAVGTVPLAAPAAKPTIPTVEFEGRHYVHVPSASFNPPRSLDLERTLVGPRLELVRAFARANDLNRIAGGGRDARLGIVSTGTVYYELREALALLGVRDDDPVADGVRLLKLGMPWPLDPEIVRTFAEGLDTVLVLEEKGPFLEGAVRHALYDANRRPRVIGELDHDGAPLVRPSAVLDAVTIARVVGPLLLQAGASGGIRARLEELEPGDGSPPVPAGAQRTPFFCSGCPHNRSTDVPDGSVVGAGIGCHGMVAINPAEKGRLSGLTQMGGEGAQWIGQAPFTKTPHIFQNLGDGTFTHSGSLAVRAAVAARVNITYNLLYNEVVAMTGGQSVEGAMPVPALTRWLELEGVRRVIVTGDEPERYRGVKLSPIAEFRPRSQLIAAQRELRETEGVTVLIHDQGCAAELRRLRKRGLVTDRVRRVAIHERVCDGCGDCGRKSHCLSVHPVETEFGPKTQVHQTSCNKDYSCLDGDCPSFLSVIPGKRVERRVPSPPGDLPEPERPRHSDSPTLRLIGIGGTGVVTAAQVVGMAALLDGKRTIGLDQTGLAQKGGPVVSDVRFLGEGAEASPRAAAGTADGYLVFDIVAGVSPANLTTAKVGHTVAIVSTSEMPTSQMIGNPDARFTPLEESLAAIDRVTSPARNLRLDALGIAERLFGDGMPANSIVLGAAWQRGLIPVSLAAFEEAFRINGAAVERNLAAFQWGRAAVARPDALAAATVAPAAPGSEPDPRAAGIAAKVGAEPGSALARLVLSRVDQLIAYQGPKLAARYADFLARTLAVERDGGPRRGVSEAVARNLFKLMAYKDEYEVARLHLDPVERNRLRSEFGADAKFRYHLHPPLLRALGMKSKLELGRWIDPLFHLLKALRRLRGTPFDLFGRAKVRRIERALPAEYRALVERALPELDRSYEDVVEICELPGLIRGYEEVKLAGVEKFRERAIELERRLLVGIPA